MVSLKHIARIIRLVLNQPPAELAAYDGISDSQDEEMMTEEQHGAICRRLSALPPSSHGLKAQMIDGLEQVRNILGDQEQSGFPDQAIKDALWEFFFDVDKSVVWLLGVSHRLHPGRVRLHRRRTEEKQKREAAKERKGEFRSYHCLQFPRPLLRHMFGCVWASAMLSDRWQRRCISFGFSHPPCLIAPASNARDS